jgi:hypothetical protein
VLLSSRCLAQVLDVGEREKGKCGDGAPAETQVDADEKSAQVVVVIAIPGPSA